MNPLRFTPVPFGAQQDPREHPRWDGERIRRYDEPVALCERFYAPPEPFDYQFCYQPKGHDGECIFEARRVSAETT